MWLALGCAGCPYVFGPPDLSGVDPPEPDLAVEVRDARIGVDALTLALQVVPPDAVEGATLAWAVDAATGEGAAAELLGPVGEDGSAGLVVPWAATCGGPTEVSVTLTLAEGEVLTDALTVDPARALADELDADPIPLPAVVCGSTGNTDPIAFTGADGPTRIELTNPRGNLDITVEDGDGGPLGIADGADDPLVLDVATPDAFTVAIARRTGPPGEWTLTVDRAP